MQLTVNREELAKAIGITQSIVEKKSTMPILLNFLMQADGKEIKLTASDLDITATIKLSADVKKKGSTTVNAKVFSDLVRELPQGEISVNLGQSERMEIASLSGKSNVKIVCISAESYPDLPGLGLNVTNQVPAEILLEMFNKTLYAASTDETKFNLNGVFVKTEKQGKDTALLMVSTDGHRLAIVRRVVSEIGSIDGIIIPRKGVVEFKRILEQPDLGSGIGVGISSGFFVVDSRDVKMSMRLIDGEFPDYSKVLPKQFSAKVSLDNSELHQSLKRTGLLVTEKNKCVRFDFTEGNLKISSSSPELGEASEELVCDYQGAPVSIGFNPKYLIDILNTLDSNQKVVMELNGAFGPARIYSESDEAYFGIVMPMRL
jgi:DNA polymerase III subunit beta